MLIKNHKNATYNKSLSKIYAQVKTKSLLTWEKLRNVQKIQD